MTEKLSQTKDVLVWLKKHRSITSWQAISMFGATRLSAIIYDLRGAGYNIESKRETVTNRYGHTSPIVKYVYRGQNEQAR